jgi:hypothetical protein
MFARTCCGKSNIYVSRVRISDEDPPRVEDLQSFHQVMKDPHRSVRTILFLEKRIYERLIVALILSGTKYRNLMSKILEISIVALPNGANATN